MRTLVSGAVLSVLGAAGQQSVGTNGITTLLAIAASGGVLSLFVSKWLNRNSDGVGLSEQAMKMVRESLKDVEVMRLEIARVSKRLLLVQQDLEHANQRIADLQHQLETANGNRLQLQAELSTTIRARDDFQRQLSELKARMAGMEAAMHAGSKGDPGPRGEPGQTGAQGERGEQGEHGKNS